jgi:hypothetical protein
VEAGWHGCCGRRAREGRDLGRAATERLAERGQRGQGRPGSEWEIEVCGYWVLGNKRKCDSSSGSNVITVSQKLRGESG